MGCFSPESPSGACTMDGVVSTKENSIWHRRVVIKMGVVHLLHSLWSVSACGCRVAFSRSRDEPLMEEFFASIDFHFCEEISILAVIRLSFLTLSLLALMRLASMAFLILIFLA